MNKLNIIEQIKEKVKDIDVCMFITVDLEGALHGRPMSTQKISGEGTVWFMTKNTSNKIAHIKANDSVSLMYDAGDRVTYVSLAGKAKMVQNQAKIDELWNPFYKAWFDSKNDPEIALIEVTILSGEYWDNKAGKLGSYWDLAKAILTNTSQEADEGTGTGENKEFNL